MRFSHDDFRKRCIRFPPYAIQNAMRSTAVVATKTRHYYEWDLNPRYARYELAALSNYAIICCCECLCVSCVPRPRLPPSSAQNADTQRSSNPGTGSGLSCGTRPCRLSCHAHRSVPWIKTQFLPIRRNRTYPLGLKPSALPLSYNRSNIAACVF